MYSRYIGSKVSQWPGLYAVCSNISFSVTSVRVNVFWDVNSQAAHYTCSTKTLTTFLRPAFGLILLHNIAYIHQLVLDQSFYGSFMLTQCNRVTISLNTHRRRRSPGSFDRWTWWHWEWHRTSPAGSGPGANCPSRLAACSNMPVETCEGSAHDQYTARGCQMPNLHSRLSDGATEALNLMRRN